MVHTDLNPGNVLIRDGAVVTATQTLHMLEVPIRQGRHDVVPGVVERGHRVLDELKARR